MMSSSIAHTFSIVMQYMIDHHYVTCINLNKYSQYYQIHEHFANIHHCIVYPRSGIL